MQHPTQQSTCIGKVHVGYLKEYLQTVDETTGKVKKTPVYYTYRDVEYDIDGWADSKRFLPEDFDLVFMRLKREKTITGWVNGNTWDGLRLKDDDEVLFWKRNEERDL